MDTLPWRRPEARSCMRDRRASLRQPLISHSRSGAGPCRPAAEGDALPPLNRSCGQPPSRRPEKLPPMGRLLSQPQRPNDPGGRRPRDLLSRERRPASLPSDADPAHLRGRCRLHTDTGPRSAELSAVPRTRFASDVIFLPRGRVGRSAPLRHGPRSSTKTAPARARPPRCS